MITKESKLKKYCCFYASDFHLEMILLPYIKNNIYKCKINILTQENLIESIKQVLDRTNLNTNEKNKILKLNWNNEKTTLYNMKENDIIIVNGDTNYIKNINKEVQNLNLKNITIINCYDLNKIKENKIDISNEYDGILNTNYITN